MADETTGPNAAKTSAGNDIEPPTWDADDPRELLNSANSAAAHARNAWLAFLGFLAYLVVAVGSVTHGDLLLDNPLRLPFANVEIPLTGFFWLAPFLLVLVHLSVLMQHAMLAHKYHHFTRAIAASEGKAPRTHPDRRLVHSYVFAQLLAGPRPLIVLEVLMRAMVWITLSVLPIATLLFFQVKFLAYHDDLVTRLQRIALVFDILLLIALPPLFCLPSLFRRRRTPTDEWRTRSRPWLPRFNKAGMEWGPEDWPWRVRWHHAVAASIATSLVVSFSLFFATVPGTRLDGLISARDDEDAFEQNSVRLASADMTRAAQQIELDIASEETRSQANSDDTETFGCGWSDLLYGPLPGTPRFDLNTWCHCLKTLLFDAEPDPVSSRPGGLFRMGRRIVFTDANAREAGLGEEHTFSLRGRELRKAHLNRAPLQAADLIGAEMREASLRFANLRGAHLCPSFEEASTSEESSTAKESLCVKLQYADLTGASLIDVELVEANLSGAILAGADLQGATMYRARLRGATLRGSNLQRAQLVEVDLRDTKDLVSADLRRATLVKVLLPRALPNVDLGGATMSDIDLEGSCLTNANLRQAELLGVNLRDAYLVGADAREATLRDATLTNANLRGADLRGADLTGADLRNAIIVDADLKGAIGVNRQGAIDVDPATALPIEKRLGCPEP